MKNEKESQVTTQSFQDFSVKDTTIKSRFEDYAEQIEDMYMNNNKGNTESSDYLYDNSVGSFQSSVNFGSFGNNRRAITWKIPFLDMVWRDDPIIKTAVEFISSKLYIKGIDINVRKDGYDGKNLINISDKIKGDYKSLMDGTQSQFIYGGGAWLKIYKGKQNKGDYKKPFVISDMDEGSFQGLKHFPRWFGIEPALDMGLVSRVDPSKGIRNAWEIGQPMYYYINVNSELYGYNGMPNSYKGKVINFGNKNNLSLPNAVLVHRSWLFFFNPFPLSFVDNRMERFWSNSIVEVSYDVLDNYRLLISATSKSAIKNNVAVMKIDGVDSAIVNKNTRKVVREKIKLAQQTGSNYGAIAIGRHDSYDFVKSSPTGNEKIIEQSMREVATSLSTPIHVLFQSEKHDSKSYLESMNKIEMWREKDIRPIMKELIMMYSRDLGSPLLENEFDFSFNSLETLTTKEKVDIIKETVEVLSIAYDDEAISLRDYQNMVVDVLTNPSNMFQNISQDYIDEVKKGNRDGEHIRSRDKQIEIAYMLNQFNNSDDDNGNDTNGKKKGIVGIEQPQSREGGKKGGDPTKSKSPFGKKPLRKGRRKSGDE